MGRREREASSIPSHIKGKFTNPNEMCALVEYNEFSVYHTWIFPPQGFVKIEVVSFKSAML